MIHKLIKVRGADFCDDQFPVISTIGRGPKGDKGDKGDNGTFPTFADPIEWDIETSYPANTVVMHDGFTYISKVDVPSHDVQIDDTDYWIKYADPNAQVEQYRQQVELTRSNLSDETRARSDADNLIESQINSLSRGIVVIGDSYGEGWTPDGNVNSWINFFKSGVEHYGYSVYSTALGGSAFYRDDQAKRFSTLLSNLVLTLTENQRESVGTVIIGGGYNDRENTRANIYDGMCNVRNVIRSNFPNVRRVLVFPFGMAVQGLTTGSHANFQYSMIVNMIKNYIDANMEARLGTIVGESNMMLRRNVYFSSDYVHPRENGNYIIGRFVTDIFMGSNSPYISKKFNDEYQPNVIPDNNVTDNNLSLFSVYTSGSNLILKCPETLTVNFSSPVDIICDIAHPVTLATFKDAAIQQYGYIVIPVTTTIRSSTSSPLRYQQIPGELVIDSGVLKFKAIMTNSEGTGFITINSVDRLQCVTMAYPSIDGLTLVG